MPQPIIAFVRRLFVALILIAATATWAVAQPAVNDDDIETALSRTFAEIETLADVTVTVEAGVVTLEGRVGNADAIVRAETLAANTEGVQTVENNIRRSLSVEDSLDPAVSDLRRMGERTVEGLPLFGLSLLLFIVIAFIAHRIASFRALWRRILPNPFLADLVAQAFRVAGILLALILALSLLGATAVIGTVLGGAGVLGIAIGFGVRDTIENYIASVMLSLRQPFRAQDHVVIDAHEGIVIRLTSRATVLMTLDGNHLRLPNALVFKAVILNYSRNPERRFGFELGVDAGDDPIAAISVAIDAMRDLPFLLTDPPPIGMIKTVGDSNIVLELFGWIDQRSADFGKARSHAIREAKNALEDGGFTLPEPIYRLRIDQAPASLLESRAPEAEKSATPSRPATQKAPTAPSAAAADIAPDPHLQQKVGEERASDAEEDLLDPSRPVE